MPGQGRKKQEDDLVERMKVSAASGRPQGSSPVPQDSSSAAAEATENLRRALRTSEATNTTGYAALQSLGKQRETIQNSIETVDMTHAHLGESRQVIRDIRFGVYKEWLIKGCVITALLALIVLLFYSKFIRAK